jgi:uncharacterized protein (AIM24 family)/cytochrome c-type biogenesis protein CcmH/NrfG
VPSPPTLDPEPARVASSAPAHMRRAGLLVSERRLAEAELEILEALAEIPDDLRAHRLLALVRFRLGRLLEARESYRRVVAAAPDDAAARLNLGLIALKLERFAEAAEELGAAVALRPDDPRPLGYLAHACARLGRTAEAARLFRQAGQPDLASEIESPLSAASQPPPPPPGDAAGSGRALADFLHGRLVDGDLVARNGAPVEGVYRLVLGEPGTAGPARPWPGVVEAHVQARALLAAVGTIAVEPARRRQRGQVTAAPLASDGAVFLACRGRGELWLTPVSPVLRLDALTLEEDVLFVRESSVLAFSGQLVWESGAIPRSGVRMLHLHGSGAVVVDWLGRDVVAIRLAEGQPLTVPLHRVCGWMGRLVLHLQQAGRLPDAGGGHPSDPALVGCEGEGVLLIARNGQTGERVHQRAESGHDGTGHPDPGRSHLHR